MINHRYKFITILYYLALCEQRGRDPSEYFKFTIVRNPWDKVVSFYHYHQRRRWDIFPWTTATEPDFNGFIRRRHLPHVNPSSHKPYLEYYDDVSREAVDGGEVSVMRRRFSGT